MLIPHYAKVFLKAVAVVATVWETVAVVAV
jgi:hypothetical protein